MLYWYCLRTFVMSRLKVHDQLLNREASEVKMDGCFRSSMKYAFFGVFLYNLLCIVASVVLLWVMESIKQNDLFT